MVYLSLGSNLGDREALIKEALVRLDAAGVRVLRASSLYETAPEELLDQPWFLNMAVAAETTLTPATLIAATQNIERELGRQRDQVPPKGPRTLDIDILLYDDLVLETAQLAIPHPRMLQRRFVLEPLCEIAPDLRHPVSGQLFSAAAGSVASQVTHKLR
jgi:2-amino-4-hydroxy-6-hydroxymethyldihydropteridine diphosphokinase